MPRGAVPALALSRFTCHQRGAVIPGLVLAHHPGMTAPLTRTPHHSREAMSPPRYCKGPLLNRAQGMRDLRQIKTTGNSGVWREKVSSPAVIPRLAKRELWCAIAHLRIHSATGVLGEMDSAQPLRGFRNDDGSGSAAQHLATAAHSAASAKSGQRMSSPLR
jgi:hypothetical protein